MDGISSNNIPKNVFTTDWLGKTSMPQSDDKVKVISQYAAVVSDFSSQYGTDSSVSYTAYNLSGKPSNYPDYGDFPQAFAMKTYGNWWKEVNSCPKEYMPQNNPDIVSHDYVDVCFDVAVYPTAVHIFETYYPGAVVRIWALNWEKRWALLWEGGPQKVEHKARKFSPPIKQQNFKTNVLRIEFNHSLLEYYTGLDAVLLSGLAQPFSSGPSQIAHEIIKRNIHNIPCNAQPIDLTELLSDYITKTAKISEEKNVEVATSKSVTFDCLPNETILKILGYLDLMSLGRVAQVSRSLYQLATDCLLYSHLSLRPYWSILTDRVLLNLIPRCSRLQRLDISWCGAYGFITTPVFERFVTECCKNLTHIRLNCCNFVRNSTVKVLAQTCPNLRELGLRGNVEINEAGFLHLTSLTQLTSLDLYRTLITGNSLVPILKGNPHLQHLNIGSCGKVTNMDEVARTLGTYNRNLLSLDLWKTVSLSQAGVRALSQCSRLEELDLGWCLSQSVPVESLTNLAHGCRNLRKLFLTALRGVTDRDLEPLATACPNLEQLDLMGVHGVTGDGCFRLLFNLERLRLLDVSFCYQISENSVEEWRAIFHNVVIKSSSQETTRSHVPNDILERL